MHMEFKINQKALESFVDPQWRREIPYVIADSINATVFAQRGEQQKAMDKHMDGGPVSWTRRGVLYKKANKRNLTGFVYYKEDRPYMRLIIDGGIDKAKKRKLSEPVNVRVTKQGNIPRTYTAKKKGDPKFFFGIPKGKTGEQNRGIWRRYGKNGYTKSGKPKGKIRLMVSWSRESRYQRETFPAREVFANHVPRYFQRHLPISLRKAIRASIARAATKTGF